MKREKRLLLSTFIMSFGTVLPKVISFLILPVMTASLTKIEYGKYDLVLTSVSLVIPLFSLLIEQGVFRFLLDSNTQNDKKKIVTNSFLFIFGTSILLFLITFVVLNRYSVDQSLLISLYFALSIYNNYAIQLCRGLGLLKIYALTSIINSILNLFLIIIFVGELKCGLQGLFTVLDISIVLSTFFAFLFSRTFNFISWKSLDYKVLKELLKYSSPLLVNSLSWWVVGVSDRWIITTFLGVEMNAIYAVANKIPSLINLLYNNFNLAWQESAIISSKDDDKERYYTNIFNYLFDFLTGSLLILLTVSPVLFKLFIDESYLLAYYQMPILFVAMFFYCLASYYGGIYVAQKETKNISITTLIAAALNLFLNLIFISKYGLYAASISTLISYLVLTLYRAIHSRKYVRIKYNYFRIVFCLTILVVVVLINHLNIYGYNIFNFSIAVITAMILNYKLLKGVYFKLSSMIRKGR